MSNKYNELTPEELAKIKAELEKVNIEENTKKFLAKGNFHEVDFEEPWEDKTYVKFHISRKHKKFLLAGLGLFGIGALGTLAFKKFDETHEVSFEAPQVDVTLPSVDVTAPSLEVEKKPAKKSE